jgi:hypothetical protein
MGAPPPPTATGRFRRSALGSVAMSRVVTISRPSARRAITLALAVGLFVSSAAPALGQDRPTCDDSRTTDCVLPDWSEAMQRDVPSLFGEIDGVAWVDDERGDAPASGLDILGVGVGRVDIAKPEPIRSSDKLLKLNKAKKAVPSGEAILIRIALDRPPNEVEGGHASIHVATDINGSRSSNVPSGVASPDFPFAGSQDIYSLTWASTTGKTKLLSSDLAQGWYKTKDPFAASWVAPNVLDVLVAPKAFGQGFRVITHTAGNEGGYDIVSYGPAAVPVDGEVGLVPACIEGSIAAVPFVVGRLNENGQTVRNVEAPASWRGGAVVPIADEVRPALEALIAERDEDGDGRIGLPTWVNLFEDGIVIRQRPDLDVALDGDLVLLSVELGLTRRGYNVLRDFEPQATGDAALDAWLERATDALRQTMPPFRSNKKGGLLIGEGIGSCIPWITPPAPVPEASDAPEPGGAAASA